jgi:hypothetical protein
MPALAAPLAAEETRELGAHEHGHGALNVAVEGNQVAIELEVPGFDIVGFEYAAKSDEDKAAIAAALKTLSDPSTVVMMPEAAGCSPTEVAAELHGDEDHDDHGHEEHAKDDHDDHGHEEHAEHDHGDEEAHSEFEVEYVMTCASIDKLTKIDLPYFETFPNAEELEIQLVTDKGAMEVEATPENPVIDLSASM